MTSPDDQPEPRTWHARVCCPECYGPVRVRPHEKEGRCRTHRPVRRHSQPRTDERTNFAQFVAEHRRATQ